MNVKFLPFVYLWLLIPLISITQNYIPFPEEDAYWTVFEFVYEQGAYEAFIYTVKDDTLLNDMLYKKIYKLNDIPYSQDTLWTLHCFMRQEIENKKIYFIRHYLGETEEKLGYDFSANNIGDTISLPAFAYIGYDSLFRVRNPAFDSIQLWNGEYRKTYGFGSLINSSSYDLFVVEGVGGHRTAFPNLQYWDPLHQSEVVCFLLNGEYLFGPSPEPDECDFTVRITDIKQNDKIICKPNPASTTLTFRYNSTDEKPEEIIIFNTYGILVKKIRIPDRQNQHTIDISSFPSGLYIAVLRNERKIIAKGKFIIAR